jgi:hypothetical protein
MRYTGRYAGQAEGVRMTDLHQGDMFAVENEEFVRGELNIPVFACGDAAVVHPTTNASITCITGQNGALDPKTRKDPLCIIALMILPISVHDAYPWYDYLADHMLEIKIGTEGVEVCPADGGAPGMCKVRILMSVNDTQGAPLLTGSKHPGGCVGASLYDQVVGVTLDGTVRYVGHTGFLPEQHPLRAEAQEVFKGKLLKFFSLCIFYCICNTDATLEVLRGLHKAKPPALMTNVEARGR